MAAPWQSRTRKSWYRPKKARYAAARPRRADYDQLSAWIDARAAALSKGRAERHAAIQATAAGDAELAAAANGRADALYVEYQRLDKLIADNMPPIRGGRQ